MEASLRVGRHSREGFMAFVLGLEGWGDFAGADACEGYCMEATAGIKHGGWKITGLLRSKQEDQYNWSTEHM